jgi:chorismate mutase
MSGQPKRLYALRGAVQASANEAEAILSATSELVGELVARNGLEAGDFVSVIFTCTDDLNAEFPAVAARRLGFEHVPLICTREIPVPGAMERVIRVMAHLYADEGHEPRHVYLGETQSLRADLHAAQ